MLTILTAQQIERLRKSFATPPCECPTCRMNRREFPEPNDVAIDTMIVGVEAFSQFLKQNYEEITFEEMKKWLQRLFVLGFAQGYAQAQQQPQKGDHNDHQTKP